MKSTLILGLVLLYGLISFTAKKDNNEKTLILIRHAKSAHDNPALADFDRFLDPKGEVDADKTGKFLNGKNLKIDLLVSSPAVRTKQTLEHLCTGLDCGFFEVKYDSSIYACSPGTLLNMIRTIPADAKTVVVLAHNPATTAVANLLQNDQQWTELPTCGVVAIKFNDVEWAEVGENEKGKLWFFSDPDKL
ncbi:MAG TPA: histidine phosphatase family protein [Flavobacteriales bacterium]|nr:histidine phosphatase family protein [Flavobacteriales bacterium]